MLSFNFFCHALPVISIIGPFVNAGFLPQGNINRLFFVTESSTSSKTTSTKSFHSSVINQPAVVVRSFPLSQDGVNCQYQALPQGHQGIQSNSYAAGSAPSSRMVANLTPHNCHVRCTPLRHDCQKIINTMRNMKQRQITIEPRNWLYVSYRQCAVVFENPGAQNVAVVYQWNRLADQAERLQSQCAGGSSTSTPGYGSGSKSTGTCFFSSCDLNDSTHPFNAARKTIANAKTSKVENSGLIKNFCRILVWKQ
ncbi:uncharacterized protein PGTG_12281 [Puccinia graminis f. sp. tritici CRL 75-36-700-3]|uniref:Secreted protein n=1 Tax=Puccinia graminis f. sp. tritici (strain CRL 75-36-700-3 / race SCCL) TaxID=418459 RepID=E3KPU0_PUCGT|nr:uncharacterized protein PGTG_12281 [Puccinia graminis f. sp. tritici CRL 75-36-700-3]EFP86325.1 hypothetical protein PGTG_12281 [Puccinia graminis f. sp. tritici CRL 75-36-700-3]